MTLTRFFTRYVYIPLGGSRKGRMKTCINVLIVFLISGLWHGANWTFVLWGACHGICSVLTRLGKGVVEKLHPVIKWLFTFGFLNITWILFRADTIGDAARLIGKILDFRWTRSTDNILPRVFFICICSSGFLFTLWCKQCL